MIRLMIPVLLAVAVVGCKGRDARVPMDPFYGQTKIAPPGTGEITRGGAVDPYYPRSASATVPEGVLPRSHLDNGSSPTLTASSGLAANGPSASRPEEPTGSGAGDRIEIPVSARRELTPAEMLAAKSPSAKSTSQRSADAASSAAASADSVGEPKMVVQTYSPRGSSLARKSSGYAQPGPSRGPAGSHRGPLDINDLPPVDRGAGTMRDDGVQQVSATEAEGHTAVRIPTRADADGSVGRYGWADDYSRLRGRLEYLESDHCWKLRYIPIDRETDEYGGSVVIEDTEGLTGFERGDFVEVRGRIAKPAEDGTDFAPVYEVRSIRHL